MLLLAAPGKGAIPCLDPTLVVGPLAFVPKGVNSLNIFFYLTPIFLSSSIFLLHSKIQALFRCEKKYFSPTNTQVSNGKPWFGTDVNDNCVTF